MSKNMEVMDKKYEQAVCGLPPRLKTPLLLVDAGLSRSVKEVCIRTSRPLVLQTFKGGLFVGRDGTTSKHPQKDSYIVTADDVLDCLKAMTEYSIHSFKDKINAGFITLSGGHRAGIVGSCNYCQDKLVGISDVSSINLRIARQIKGIGRNVTKQLFCNGLCSTLIVGCPSSGKTTLLRDIALWLSGVSYGYKVCIVDERGEIAAVQAGVPQNEVGVFADVLDGYKKGEGMSLAVRSMSPDVIVIDEIGSESDAQAIMQSLNAGVCVIASVHAGSVEELYKKEHIMALIKTGFDKIVMLKGAEFPCVVSSIQNTSGVGI